METEGYEKPQITDFGSLERLTAACSRTGLGDVGFTGDLNHTPGFNDSQGFCTSGPPP